MIDNCLSKLIDAKIFSKKYIRKYFDRNLNEKLHKVLLCGFSLQEFYLNILACEDLNDPVSREDLISKCILLFHHHYVYLSLKTLRSGKDPILELHELANDIRNRHLNSVDYFKKISNIFASLEDGHTLYKLPGLISEYTAILPVYIERYHDREFNAYKYIITNTIKGLRDGEKLIGAIVNKINGVPINTWVAEDEWLNAEHENSGYNHTKFNGTLKDKHLTIRPQLYNMFTGPDYYNLDITLKGGSHANNKISFPWLVINNKSFQDTLWSGHAESEINYLNESCRVSKRFLFTHDWENYAKAIDGIETNKVNRKYVYTQENINIDIISNAHAFTSLYIRIFAFPTSGNAEGYFVEAGEELSKINPEDVQGIIIDLRGNPGGSIIFAERLASFFIKKGLEPQKVQYRNTLLNYNLSKKMQTSDVNNNAMHKFVSDSIVSRAQEGLIYSAAVALSDDSLVAYNENNPFSLFSKNVIVIVDDQTYSAAEVFVAAIKDHSAGLVLGVDASNTGGGGANVFRLVNLFQYPENSMLSDLTRLNQLSFTGSNFIISNRRLLRAGKNSGKGIEDVGVSADYIYRLSKSDLLNRNNELLLKALSLLESQQNNNGD